MRRYSLSKYDPTPAEICFPKYVQAINAREYLFFLEGNTKKLQEVCDAWFNLPSGNAIRIEPLSHWIIARITDCNCPAGTDCSLDETEPSDCNPETCRTAAVLNEFQEPSGYMMYNLLEFSFFAKDANGEVFMCSPFRYTNNGILMVNERELFGFPTSYAEFGHYFEEGGRHYFRNRTPIEYFAAPSDEGYQCTTMMHFAFPKGNIIEEEAAEGGIETKPEVLIEFNWNNRPQTAYNSCEPEAIRDHIHSILNNGDDGKIEQYSELMTDLLGKKRRFVSLIQFRDIVNPDNAMVQSIFEVQGEQVEVLRGGIGNGRFSLNFNYWESSSVNHAIKMQQQRLVNAQLGVSLVEQVKNNIHIAEVLGIEKLDDIPCCYIDTNATLSVSKVFWKEK